MYNYAVSVGAARIRLPEWRKQRNRKFAARVCDVSQFPFLSQGGDAPDIAARDFDAVRQLNCGNQIGRILRAGAI